MIAKVSWNMENTVSGIVPLTALKSTPERNDFANPPYHAFAAPPSPKAML